MTELDLANHTGSIEVDGKIVTKSQILPAFPNNDPGIEVNTFKAAIEPVWHLPGLAKRFEVSEELLRRALFEGMSIERGGERGELNEQKLAECTPNSLLVVILKPSSRPSGVRRYISLVTPHTSGTLLRN